MNSIQGSVIELIGFEGYSNFPIRPSPGQIRSSVARKAFARSADRYDLFRGEHRLYASGNVLILETTEASTKILLPLLEGSRIIERTPPP